ncbi:MAG: hypothetical protein ABIH57_03200 [Candidatus Omnitrophota bacterium]
MNNKIIVLISLFILFGPNSVCLAGKTSFSGSASCFMPYQLEINEEQTTPGTNQETQAPAVSGANGDYDIQEEILREPNEEKTLWDGKDMAQIEETTSCPSCDICSIGPEQKIKSETILYTIYAR